MEGEWREIVQGLNGSKEAIFKARSWALEKVEQQQITSKSLVRVLTSEVERTADQCPFKKALFVLYLVNDIIFRGSQSQPRTLTDIVEALSSELKTLMAETISKAQTQNEKKKVADLFQLWWSKNVIHPAILDEVKEELSKHVELPDKPPSFGHSSKTQSEIPGQKGAMHKGPQLPDKKSSQPYPIPPPPPGHRHPEELPVPPQTASSEPVRSTTELQNPPHFSDHNTVNQRTQTQYDQPRQSHTHPCSHSGSSSWHYNQAPQQFLGTTASSHGSYWGGVEHSSISSEDMSNNRSHTSSNVQSSVQQAAAAAAQVAAHLQRPRRQEQEQVPPSQQLEKLQVGNMVDIIRTALENGYSRYQPIDPTRLPPTKRKSVEPGRLEVRQKQFQEKVSKDQQAEERRKKRESKRVTRRRKREIRRQRRREGRPSRSPSSDRDLQSSSESEASANEHGAVWGTAAESEPFPQYGAAPIKVEKASTDTAINESNVGRKMLARMGWREGEGLGTTGNGLSAPIDPTRESHSGNDRTGLGNPKHDGAASGAVDTIREKGEEGFADAVAAFRSRFSGQYHANLEQKRSRK